MHTTDGLISGRYRLGELLGTGGSASVFAAVDTEAAVGADPSIALKILHPHLSRSESSREAFFAEARAAARVRHPNIVAVLDVGVHDAGADPLAWIALERAPGSSLAEYVDKRGALTVEEALTVAEGVLLALHAAHSAGLIHRDISPANIMVHADQGGTIPPSGVRLLDFGLADAAGRPVLGTNVLRSSPEPGATSLKEIGVLGSVNYMSPEQARGETVDERGDIYQLAGVLHFALTARPPFPRDTGAAVMRAHVQAPPPVPSVLHSGIPRGVDRIVVKGLLKAPGDRYQSAAEMGEAVAELSARRDGDDRTRVLDADFAKTTAIPRYSARAASLAATASASNSPGKVRPASLPGVHGGQGRTGAWAAGLFVVAGIVVAWVAASGAQGQPVVTQTSAPAISATAAPTAEPTPSATAVDSVRVPELISMSLADARAALSAAGLHLGSLSRQESVRAGDTVLGLAPQSGEWVAVGRSVDLIVSSGSNRVPRVAGLAKAEAIALIQSAGFVAVTEQREVESGGGGIVLASVPDEGTVLRLGTSVVIAVAISSPPAVSPTPTPSRSAGPTVAPTPAPTPPTLPPSLAPLTP